VTELVWEHPGRPAIQAVKVGDRWELRTPNVAADAGAIGDVLAALRGGRWHRRGDARPVHATLTVVMGGERHVLGIADPIAGSEQSWMVDDGRGVLVDSWLARTLDRDLLSLRVRQPFAAVSNARSIRITGRLTGSAASAGPGAHGGAGGAAEAPVELQIDGTPRRMVRPWTLLLAPALAGDLEQALREVTIVRIPDGAAGAHGLAIRMLGDGAAAASIEIGGGCPGAADLVAMSDPRGDGCVERAALAAVERAVARLQQPAEAVVERRPVPIELHELILADGSRLELSPPQVEKAAADPDRVAELLAALAAPGGVAPRPAGRPIGEIVANVRGGGTIALDLYAEHVVARRVEPVALVPPPGAWSLLVRPGRALRDPALWLEEPTTITQVDIDGVSYRRGAVIGQWSREPAGAVDGARVEALVAALAAPRAVAFIEEPPAAVHRVTIEVTPPAGAPSKHVLELDASGPSGCRARAGSDWVLLPAALCAQVEALSPRSAKH
jgi:hypothetical protein